MLKLFPYIKDLEVKIIALENITNLACRIETSNVDIVKLMKNRDVLCKVKIAKILFVWLNKKLLTSRRFV